MSTESQEWMGKTIHEAVQKLGEAQLVLEHYSGDMTAIWYSMMEDGNTRILRLKFDSGDTITGEQVIVASKDRKR